MLTSPQAPLSPGHAASSGWPDRLRESHTPAAVIDVARDFLASWTPAELASLPRECRPGKLVDAEDITGLAFALTQRSCALDRLSDERLHRLANFFTEASLRLAVLLASAKPSPFDATSRQ